MGKGQDSAKDRKEQWLVIPRTGRGWKELEKAHEKWEAWWKICGDVLKNHNRLMQCQGKVPHDRLQRTKGWRGSGEGHGASGLPLLLYPLQSFADNVSFSLSLKHVPSPVRMQTEIYNIHACVWICMACSHRRSGIYIPGGILTSRTVTVTAVALAE